MAIALSLAFTPTPLDAGEQLVIECTRQVSPGISFLPRSEYKVVAIGADATTSPQNILAAYNAIFGALIAGQKIFCRARILTSAGFAGAALKTAVEVT